MSEYISREAAIAYIREQSEECQKAFEELGGESGIYADAYNDLAEDFYGIPAAKAVSLHDIYRVIAGHSYYHGDRILAALTCIAEGQEVNPVRPADVAPVVRCKDCKHFNHKRMECGNEAISTDHEGGAQYSLNFWSDDFCSYGEPMKGAKL